MKGTKRNYISLDDLSERNLAKTDLELFQLHKPPALIDDVKYALELFTYIKIHVDKLVIQRIFGLPGRKFLS